MRYVTMALGLFYLVLAYSGFMEISDSTTHFGGGLYGGNSPELLWGVFGVNTAMNFIHLLLGVLTIVGGVMMSRLPGIAWFMVAGFTILAGYGIVAIITNTGTTSLAITWGDNILHLATAAVIAVLTILSTRTSRRQELAQHH